MNFTTIIFITAIQTISVSIASLGVIHTLVVTSTFKLR